MSDPKETGGPAFPTQESSEYNGRRSQYAEPGMTLRDYFAAKAMHGILRNNQGSPDWNDDLGAKSAYEIADAMLKARNS